MNRAATLVSLLAATMLAAPSLNAQQTWPSSLPPPSAQQQAINELFMAHASYFAGSIADPDAFGHGTSTNMPQPLMDRSLAPKGLQALLKRGEKGFELAIANTGAKPEWLKASDSNILGYLQAKDSKGAWRPIEYHWWASCGNSYHRVQLPSGQAWNFSIVMPMAGARTKVRWHYQNGNVELNSNEVEAFIPATRFQVAPTLEDSHDLSAAGDYPSLVPKGGPRGG